MTLARNIWMKRPFNFGYHGPSAESNHFQYKPLQSNSYIRNKAMREFDGLVETLDKAHIAVDVLPVDHIDESKDAVFLNNWFSSHTNGLIILYPMYVEARRSERKMEILDYIESHYEVRETWSMAHFEEQGMFLESTGSMVFDHVNQAVFACRSPRTSPVLLNKWAERMKYKVFLFDAFDKKGYPIYHTNVLMSMGTDFVIINRNAILPKDWSRLHTQFQNTHKEVIDISMLQMNQFLGNAIVLSSTRNSDCLLMSTAAYTALTIQQMYYLTSKVVIVHYPIPTIERVGGGSVRCMIAENHLNRK